MDSLITSQNEYEDPDTEHNETIRNIDSIPSQKQYDIQTSKNHPTFETWCNPKDILDHLSPSRQPEAVVPENIEYYNSEKILEQYILVFKMLSNLAHNMKVTIASNVRAPNTLRTLLNTSNLSQQSVSMETEQRNSTNTAESNFIDKATNTNHRKPMTKEQQFALTEQYLANPYPNREEYDDIATNLDLPRAKIIQYFHNKRARSRILIKHNTPQNIIRQDTTTNPI